jgi:hypothetical protein
MPENPTNANVNSSSGNAPAAAPKFAEIVSEGIRNDQAYKGFIGKFGDKSADEVAKAYLNAEQALSRKLEGYGKKPGENATPDEIAAWNAYLGVPAKPEEYGVQGEGWDQDRVNAFLPEAHKLGLTKNQVEGLIQMQFANEQTRRQADEEAYASTWKEYYPDDAAKGKGVETGKRTLARIAETNPKLAKDLEIFLGKDAHFTAAMEMLAKEFGEAQGIKPGEAQSTDRGVDQQIKELTEKLQGKMTSEDRKMARNTLADLMYKKEGIKVTYGD